MKSVGTIVTLSFILAGLLVWVVLDKAMTALWAIAGWINAPLIGAGFTTTTGIAFAVAVLATVITWRHPTVNGLSREVVQELKKVSWPTRPETRANTIVVITFSFIMAGILGIFDYFFAVVSDGFFTISLG